MQVHIIRDSAIMPGGEGFVSMPGEQLLFVSEQGITQDGVDSLASCWGWYFQEGIWRFGEPGGEPISTFYRQAHLDDDVAVRIRTQGGHVHAWFSPQHFTKGSVNGLQIAVRAAVRLGWRYYAPAKLDVRVS